ncbi:ABC transporter substrate-binding protein [Dehalogenimonas sp. THU2]|uniref:ABC transporter substrate-binding protein n=1 Tax=Dehalogenimonas sp. THU2 TaxID=3151121 RepID=UPI003218CF07
MEFQGKPIRIGKKMIILGIAALSIILPLGLTACGTDAVTPPQTTDSAVFPMTITDDAGRTVTIAKQPEKIVSLIPSHTENLFALGVGNKVVGVDDFSDYPPAALDKPKMGNLFSVNYEAIVSAVPDLVLVDISAVGMGVVDQLTNVLGNTPVVVIKGTSVSSFQEVYDSIGLMGKIVGAPEKAEQIVSDMKARVKAVTDKTSGLTAAQKPRTVYIIWPEPMYIHGSNGLGSALIVAAGGLNIFIDNTGDAVQLEELVSRNPQIILASASESMGDFAYQFALTDSRLDTTEAKINGAIYGMNDDFTARPGPRLVEGLESMAKLLHPELFG